MSVQHSQSPYNGHHPFFFLVPLSASPPPSFLSASPPSSLLLLSPLLADFPVSPCCCVEDPAVPAVLPDAADEDVDEDEDDDDDIGWLPYCVATSLTRMNLRGGWLPPYRALPRFLTSSNSSFCSPVKSLGTNNLVYIVCVLCVYTLCVCIVCMYCMCIHCVYVLCVYVLCVYTLCVYILCVYSTPPPLTTTSHTNVLCYDKQVTLASPTQLWHAIPPHAKSVPMLRPRMHAHLCLARQCGHLHRCPQQRIQHRNPLDEKQIRPFTLKLRVCLHLNVHKQVACSAPLFRSGRHALPSHSERLPTRDACWDVDLHSAAIWEGYTTGSTPCGVEKTDTEGGVDVSTTPGVHTLCVSVGGGAVHVGVCIGTCVLSLHVWCVHVHVYNGMECGYYLRALQQQAWHTLSQCIIYTPTPITPHIPFPTCPQTHPSPPLL